MSSQDYPRLCWLKKWPDFGGYGFNLHAEKGKPGQYIGSIDPKSPAEVGGLRANDRVIEVNNVNVCNENHQQVVARIRENPNEVSMLVITPEGERSCFKGGKIVSVAHPDLITIRCPDSNPYTTSTPEVSMTTPDPNTPIFQQQQQKPVSQQPVPQPIEPSNNYNGDSNHKSQPQPTPAEPNDLDNMTAAQLRQKLANKKRSDIKSDGTFHDKAKMFQQL